MRRAHPPCLHARAAAAQVRGNFKVPAIKEGHEKALEKSAAFFKEHLGK